VRETVATILKDRKRKLLVVLKHLLAHGLRPSKFSLVIVGRKPDSYMAPIE